MNYFRPKVSYVFLIFISLVFDACTSNQDYESFEKPNILILFADDLGYEKLSCYGGLEIQTPNIDQLAQNGMLFKNTYTSPVCTPSRMSFYTGEYAPRHKYSTVLPVHLGTTEKVDFEERFTSYAKLLQKAGYQTSVTGKWQLATLEFHPNHIKTAGFDSWCVWQIWKKGAKTTRYWNPTFNRDGKIMDVKENEFGSDILSQYVIDRMKTASKAKQPFLIHHNIMLPHYPILQTPDDKLTNREPSLDNMILYLDKQIGIITKALTDLKLEKNTYVFFMGDNGTESDLPRKTKKGIVTGGKHQLNHGGMHVPFIAYSPGKIKSKVIADDLIDFVDFFPTICELANVELPEGAGPDGIPFTDVLHGKGKSKRSWITGGINDDFCVFDGKWRLHAKDEKLMDCRELPKEKNADLREKEAQKAKQNLQPIIEQLKNL